MSGHLDAVGLVSGHGGPAPGTDWRLDETRFDGPPALFDFGADGTGAVPSVIRATPLEALVLRGARVAGLNFLEERTYTANQPIFVSNLLFGTLILTDIQQKIALPEAAPLRLTGAAGVVTALRVMPEGISATVEGTARGVTPGAGIFTRGLKPSILEYLFRQQRLGFFRGSVVFMGACMEWAPTNYWMRSWRITLVALTALIVAQAHGKAADGEQAALNLRTNVVRVIAHLNPGGPAQEGFGFVVAEDLGQLYIVTANHVVRGVGPDEIDTTPTVFFFPGSGHAVRW